MFWGTIHRMILVELIKIFSLALIALTGLILLAGVIAEAMKSGLGPMQILAVIPLLLPSMLPYTVPTTTLFATCIVYGRLAADNEILALKAAGVHIIHVIWPALLLGILASAMTMLLYLHVIPYTHFLMKSEITGDVEELLYGLLRRDGCIKHKNINYEIHVKSVQGRILKDVIFKRQAANGKGFDVVASAREAELHVDLATQRIMVEMRQCQVVQHQIIGVVERNIWPVDIPSEFGGAPTKARPTDMTWTELFEYEGLWQDDKEKLGHDIDIHQAQINMGRGESHYPKHIRDQINKRKIRESQILSLYSERHMRPAFALGCLCFALVGCPIGIWFSKSDYLSSFITCFLPIVTLYYPVMFCMINLARSGRLPPWLCNYNADLLMLLVGLILFRRLIR